MRAGAKFPGCDHHEKKSKRAEAARQSATNNRIGGQLLSRHRRPHCHIYSTKDRETEKEREKERK